MVKDAYNLSYSFLTSVYIMAYHGIMALIMIISPYSDMKYVLPEWPKHISMIDYSLKFEKSDPRMSSPMTHIPSFCL